MRHSSVSRLASIACLTTVVLTAQFELAAAFPFPFNLNGLHSSQNSSSTNEREQSQAPRSVRIRVRRTIARETGIPASRLRVVTVTEQTWQDGCLGLGGPAELCTTALVPGWRVTVTDGSQTWIYRTDSTGQVIRQESQTGQTALPEEVSDRILAAASRESGIPVERLRITYAEEKTWDGCLGIETGTAMCPQIAIFGWRVVVFGNGKSWVYHSNGDGSEIRLNRFATASLDGVRFLSGLTAPLEDQVLFRSTASGDIAGYTYETVLLKSGQVIRSLLRADQSTFSPHIHQVSKAQVQQFEKLLQRFQAFDRLSYASGQPTADAITITLTSQTGTTQYVDFVASQLPPDLLAIVQAWGAIVAS
jgi:hypothetical protein